MSVHLGTMPIYKSSDDWKSGEKIDWPIVYVEKVLFDNSEKALTVEDIAKSLIEGYTRTLPKSIREEYDRGNEGALISYVSSTLAHMQWRSLVDYRVIEEGDDTNVYFVTETEGSRYPIADIVDDLFPRVDKLENDKIEEIENRLANLEMENW